MAIVISLILKRYDNKVVPELGGGLQLDTAIIAMVSILRISMNAFVEAALSQAAWVWLSEMSQRRCRHKAYLSDFRIFVDASRGIWGSLCLLWRMKFRHGIGCIGAAVIILAHGFETFSQQMVTFEQQLVEVANGISSPAPPPSRSEIWDTYLARGYTGDYVPALSTKAAVYSGIISTEIPMMIAACETGNCSWPTFPTLATCGECTPVPVSSTCNQTSRTCNYSTDSGTLIEDPIDASDHSSFIVSPSNGTIHPIKSATRAYFSVFDMLSVNRLSGQSDLAVSGTECALWFCIRGYKVVVNEGKQNQTIIGDWSNTTLQHGNGFRGSEYVFVNIPDEFNVDKTTRYSISYEAMMALRGFMADVTSGTLYADFSMLDYSSDWVEAMWNASDSPQDWIRNLAHSLTVEIRQHGKTNEQTTYRYNGAALHLAPVVKVQ